MSSYLPTSCVFKAVHHADCNLVGAQKVRLCVSFFLQISARVPHERGSHDQLCSIAGRMGASFNALSSNGVRHGESSRFNQLASELAFHRCRVSRVSTQQIRMCLLRRLFVQALGADEQKSVALSFLLLAINTRRLSRFWLILGAGKGRFIELTLVRISYCAADAQGHANGTASDLFPHRRLRRG